MNLSIHCDPRYLLKSGEAMTAPVNSDNGQAAFDGASNL
jgi:hypothetical protein